MRHRLESTFVYRATYANVHDELRKITQKRDDSKKDEIQGKGFFPIIPEISDVRHVMEQGRSHWMYSFCRM